MKQGSFRARTIWHFKHLDAKDAHGAFSKCSDGFLSEGSGFQAEAGLAAAEWSVDEVADVVPVHGLDGGVALHAAVGRSDDHDGDFSGEGGEALGVERALAAATEGIDGGGDVVEGLQEVVAASVVGHRSALEHEGQTESVDGRLDAVCCCGRCRGFNGDGVGQGNAVFRQVHLLGVLVLNGQDDFGAGVDGDALAGSAAGGLKFVSELGEGVGVDMLNLNGDDVDLAAELFDVGSGGEGPGDVGVVWQGDELFGWSGVGGV